MTHEQVHQVSGHTTAAREAYNRHDGGIAAPDDILDDTSMESLEQLKSTFFQTPVVLSHEEARDIEYQT